MRAATVSRAWAFSRFTGLFAGSGPLRREAHDPDVEVWAGLAPLPQSIAAPPASGGAGLDPESAEAAGVGEAIERWQTWPLPIDQCVEASYDRWPFAEPAVAPDQWVLFHDEQYAPVDFPYHRFTGNTVCRWVCFRRAGDGSPFWVPEELAFLALPPGRVPKLCPMLSTGLACGRWGDPVLLRGLQETIERDAVVGAGWGRYPLEEYPPAEVWASLDASVPPRFVRPNLRYRFFRVITPFSGHVTIVTLEGEDRVGDCFSVGSACRETRAASWLKSLLEVVQGRHYVRHLKAERLRDGRPVGIPRTFADHAVYYSLFPERLGETMLGRVSRAASGEGEREGFAELSARLGPDRPVLFRSLTPPGLASERFDFVVLRVLVPGLQPLHGDHALPFLGGPLWAPRSWADWAGVPPHPFP